MHKPIESEDSHVLMNMCRLGGHLTFTSIIQLHYSNTPASGRRGATLSATYLGGHLAFTSNHRHADRQTDKTDIQDRQTRQTDRTVI